ncbi:MAG TPA: ATP-binding protein [Methylomirabilota bacterium]|nr:ATP-binding protein [Methylomirabilota bacterium]
MGLLENLSIRRKLIAVITATSTAALILAAIGFMVSDAIETRRSMVEDVKALGGMIGSWSSGSVAFADPDSARGILDALKIKPNIITAALYTAQGEEVSSVTTGDPPPPFNATRPGPEAFFNGNFLEYHGPIIHQNEVIGRVFLRSNLLPLAQRRQQFAWIVIALVAVGTVAALLLSSAFQRVISRPILKLAEVTRQVSAQKNYNLRAPKHGNDETGELIDGFNEMLNQIQIRDAELEKARSELEIRVQERTKELQDEVMERREAEEQLRATATQLERSNKELQSFAYVASHDLQEPLRKVQAFADRLKLKHEAALDEEGRDYLNRMQSAAKRMQTLIEDLLSFSRVATKVQPFELVDLNKVARDVISDLEVRIQQSQGVVEVGPLCSIQADPTQMRQLIQNLVGNALKFRKPEEPPRVKIESRQQASESAPSEEICRLTITDNGIGFDEKYLDRIFGVFQRLHARSVYEGTGIGLAICRKIVERHGGEITARSIPGVGSSFIVSLPIEQNKTRA